MVSYLYQIKILDIDFVLTLEHLIIASKIFIITFIFSCVFLLKGSMRTPLKNLYHHTKLVRGMYRFLMRMRFTIEWALFTSMTPFSYDLRITALTKCGIKYEWFLLRDGDDIFDKRFCVKFGFSRVVLSTHYRRLFYSFLNTHWLSAAKEFCKDRALELSTLTVDVIAFSSFAPVEEIESRQVHCKVVHTYKLFTHL